jgi:hypothetical protein
VSIACIVVKIQLVKILSGWYLDVVKGKVIPVQAMEALRVARG